MSKGHVTGSKHEKPGSTDWYKDIEAETLRQVEEGEQEKQEQE